MSHWSCPTQAIAVTLGGGGPVILDPWITTRNIIIDQNAKIPLLFFGFVTLTYNTSPNKNTSDSITISTIALFHSPNPTIADPHGKSGRSGR